MADAKQVAAPGEPVERAGRPGDIPELWWLGLQRKWWVLAAVGLGTFMTALGSSIVNIVLPVIMREYGIDFATAQWVMMIYLVVISGLLLTFGRLGDMLGYKRVYLLGFAIFTVGSLLCGLAPTAMALIGTRALQAVGAAMLFSNSPAILTTAFPGRQRGQALGMLGTMTYLGLMVGPAFGGYLTDQLGWRATFFINLPIGLLAIALAYVAIPTVRPPARGERFDPLGALTFVGGLSALLLALSEAQNWGWASGGVLGLLAAAVLLLGTFLRIERRIRHPMLDLSLFGSRLFAAATASALLNYMCVYAVMFLVPFYLIQYRGFSPGQTGLLLTAQALTMAIIAPLSGSLSDRIGSRLLSSLGMAVLTVALVLLGTVDAATDNVGIMARLVLIGVGAGFFVSPNSNALMGAAPRQRQGVAAAVLAAGRNVGMVLGVALAGAVFAASLAAHGGSIGPSAGFLPAFRDTFFVVAVCGALGMLTSLARGGSLEERPTRRNP